MNKTNGGCMNNSEVKSEVSKLIKSPAEFASGSSAKPDVQSPAGNKSSASGWSKGTNKKGK